MMGNGAGQEIRQTDFNSLIAAGGQGAPAVENIMFKDVNGDGAEEALVLARAAGESRPLDIYLYELKDGKPEVTFKLTAVAHGGATIQGPRLVVMEGQYEPGDPPCCPSRQSRTYYTYQNSTFVKEYSEMAPAGVSTP